MTVNGKDIFRSVPTMIFSVLVLAVLIAPMPVLVIESLYAAVAMLAIVIYFCGVVSTIKGRPVKPFLYVMFYFSFFSVAVNFESLKNFIQVDHSGQQGVQFLLSFAKWIFQKNAAAGALLCILLMAFSFGLLFLGEKKNLLRAGDRRRSAGDYEKDERKTPAEEFAEIKKLYKKTVAVQIIFVFLHVAASCLLPHLFMNVSIADSFKYYYPIAFVHTILFFIPLSTASLGVFFLNGVRGE